jgi:2-polyprenyl-3-methyl-5-hydroxy-6-metoxy-1,4-benzoquinol methylase
MKTNEYNKTQPTHNYKRVIEETSIYWLGLCSELQYKRLFKFEYRPLLSNYFVVIVDTWSK